MMSKFAKEIGAEEELPTGSSSSLQATGSDGEEYQELKLAEVTKGCRLYARKKSLEDWCLAEVMDVQKKADEVQYFMHFNESGSDYYKWITPKDVDLSIVTPTKPTEMPMEVEGNDQTKELNALLKIGDRLKARFRNSSDWYLAEVLAMQIKNDKMHYYMHYVNFNRRLDDWLTVKDLDLTNVKAAAVKLDLELIKGWMRNIEWIELGKYRIKPWYFSPYPEELCQIAPVVYLCEFCLSFFKSKFCLQGHLNRWCKLAHPPGDEVYRKNGISVFRIVGNSQLKYARNLALLSKLFLDHKCLDYDMDIFTFFVMTEYDERGFHIVGYFSREDMSNRGYNLSCILVLPPYQNKGYSKLLIEFSYVLSKAEGKIGRPERPLSDLGLLSYRSYWKNAILDVMVDYKSKDLKLISLNTLTDLTGIHVDDLVYTLDIMHFLRDYHGQKILCFPRAVLEGHKNKANANANKIDAGFLQLDDCIPVAKQRKMRSFGKAKHSL